MQNNNEIKYLVHNLGIGDLVFFCGDIILNRNPGELIQIKFNSDIIYNYREGSAEYEAFIKKFLAYFLDDYILHFLPNSEPTNTDWKLQYNNPKHYDSFQKILKSDKVFNRIKEKLSTNINSDSEYIVLFTKVRDLDLDTFSSISNEFFNYLNNSDKKILLLGERSVTYKGEYACHGKNKIYSIYQSCINQIEKNKIVDRTIDNYEFKNFSLNSILNDIGIISQSNHTFAFGGGGFFCLSLFTNKLISLTNTHYYHCYGSENTKNLFEKPEDFITHINKL